MTAIRRWLAALLALAAVLVLTRPATGADAAWPHRLVRWFDFEEREKGNFEDLPMNWYPVGRDPLTSDAVFLRQPAHQQLVSRPGYPSYARVGFSEQHAVSGLMSLHLGLDGGNVGAYLEVGTITAVPGSDYLVTAMVRTQDLSAARAHLAATLIDAHGRPIQGSRSLSAPMQSQGSWSPVSVRVAGDYPGAAYIQLEVLLLQPQPRAGNPLGLHEVVLQDIRGGAWFDDIGVWQLPNVQVTTQSPTNLLLGQDRPELSVVVRDLTARRLSATVQVYDIERKLVTQQQRTVGAGQPIAWTWTPDLPAFGWYYVQLLVSEQHGATTSNIARSATTLLWLPAIRPLSSGDRGRFALDAQRARDGELSLLGTLMQQTGVARAVVSVWDSATVLETLEQRQAVLDDVLDQATAADAQIVLSLDPLPDDLAQRSGVTNDQPLGALQAEALRWQPLLAPVLLRHGQRVSDWQIGAPGRATPFFESRLPEATAGLLRLLEQMVPGPRLWMPGSLEHDRRSDLSANLVHHLEASEALTPSAVGKSLGYWAEAQVPVWVQIQTPTAAQTAQALRVDDLVLKMLAAWQHEPAGLTLQRPWTDARLRESRLAPDPLLGAFAMTAQRLAGRRIVGELALGAGLRCLILDGPGGGLLAAWNESGPDGAVADLWLGPAPAAIDVWGNRQPLEAVDGRHRLRLTRTPQFIDGINVELALFRAGFHIDPPMIESLQVPHKRTLTVTNPWSRTISGHLQILGPEDWTIQPARHYFSIASGRTLQLPVEVVFPVAEVAGEKSLVARFDFDADVHYDVDLTAPMSLGLSDVELEASAALEDGPGGRKDLVLVCIITNRSRRPQSLLCFASLPGHERQNRPVSRLEPGQAAVRRFRFEDAAAALASYPLRTGVREVNGPAVLNRKLTITDVR